jgi:hypothetical protein
VRVRRRAVDVKVVLLDVLTVIAFRVGQAKQPFLQDPVPAIPQGQRPAQALRIIGIAGNAILTPFVRARAGLVMRKIVPCVAAFAIVLPNGAPLALAQVGSSFLPGSLLRRAVQWDLLLCFLFHSKSPNLWIGQHMSTVCR